MYVKVFLRGGGLYIIWTLYSMCILMSNFVLSLQYFEKSVCLWSHFLYCSCFVAVFTCIFSIIMTCSTSYCSSYKLMDPWNICACGCICVYLQMIQKM
jgi:hypothetical protein